MSRKNPNRCRSGSRPLNRKRPSRSCCLYLSRCRYPKHPLLPHCCLSHCRCSRPCRNLYRNHFRNRSAGHFPRRETNLPYLNPQLHNRSPHLRPVLHKIPGRRFRCHRFPEQNRLLQLQTLPPSEYSLLRRAYRPPRALHPERT